MEANTNNLNLEILNRTTVKNSSGQGATTHTSLLHVAFQYVRGAARLYHIEIDTDDSRMQVMKKIRKRYFSTMSLAWRLWRGNKIELTTAKAQAIGNRDMESQTDGFEVKVTNVQTVVPFLTNGLRDPSRIASVQESIYRHIAFAAHLVFPTRGAMKQTAEYATAPANEELTKYLPANRVEGKSVETVKASTEGTTQSIAESTATESAERARKKTAGESAKNSPVSHAEGTSGETAGGILEGFIERTARPTAESITVDTAEGVSKEICRRAVNETAGASAKNSPVNRDNGTYGVTVDYSTEGTTRSITECITTHTTGRTSKDSVQYSTKDSQVILAEGSSREMAENSTEEITQVTAENTSAETTSAETTNRASKDLQDNRAEGTYASTGETAEQNTASNSMETSELNAQGDGNVLLARTVWSRKIFFCIVFASTIIGATAGIVVGVSTKSVQNGAAVGSIFLGLIPALQSLVLRRNL
ncbi:hypothetical protein RUND412_008784 [Rhizina undulata]